MFREGTGLDGCLAKCSCCQPFWQNLQATMWRSTKASGVLCMMAAGSAPCHLKKLDFASKSLRKSCPNGKPNGSLVKPLSCRCGPPGSNSLKHWQRYRRFTPEKCIANWKEVRRRWRKCCTLWHLRRKWSGSSTPCGTVTACCFMFACSYHLGQQPMKLCMPN